MQIIKRSPEEERKYLKNKRREEINRNKTLFWAKLLKKDLDPSDTRTMQKHLHAGGGIDFYVENSYLRDGASFINVQIIKEDTENQRYVYKGMIGSANNAIGIIETNIPLTEIVANPYGNIKFLEMLSEENAMKVCNEYYEKIGEPLEPLKGHKTYFSKPTFILGTLLKERKNIFSYTNNINQDIEEMLEKQRNEAKRIEEMREKDSIEVDLGGGTVIARRDCWLEQGKQISFAGINAQALYWKYTPEKPILLGNGEYYIQIGNLQIGKSEVSQQENKKFLKFSNPYVYDNIVLFTRQKNLVRYFLEDKFNGLDFTLGEMFNTYRIDEDEEKSVNLFKEIESNLPIIVGGIEIGEDGIVKETDSIPEIVIQSIRDRFINRTERQSNIIKFDRENY